MKKIFTLVAAVLATISLSATQTVLEPGNNQLTEVLAAAQAGDTIVFKTGVYQEDNTRTIEKKVTFIAAKDAKPELYVAKLKPHAEFEMNGIDIHLNGVDYLIRTEAGGDFSVIFRNCLFHDCKSVFYYLSSGQTINSLIVDNCIFRDNTVRAENGVINGQGTFGRVSITNTTVYNATGNYAIRILNVTDSTIIDHCTFYNCGERVLLIGENGGAPKAAVSNCIISNPAAVTGYCLSTYGGTVDNILYFNTAKGPRSSDATVSGSINADPIFADPANGDFNLTKGSPAIGAATDKSNLGDPRWTVYDPTAIVNTKAAQNSNKIMVNGQLVIVRDGEQYNVLGTKF